MNPWRIRPYRPGDEVHINQSFRKVFRLARSLEEWRWKFCGQNVTPFSMLAVDESGQVFAQYAAVPVFFQTPIGRVLAGQVVDVFSLPEARTSLAAGKAYLEAMAAFFERWGGREGMALLFGFPSNRPLRLGTVTGRYSQIPDQPVWHLRWFRGSLPFVKRRHFTTAWGIAPSVWERLWELRSARFVHAAVRDASYIRWRYLRHPKAVYLGLSLFEGEAPVACLIFRPLGETIALVDWVAVPERDVWLQLLHAIVRSPFWESRKHLEAWICGDQATLQVLQDIGFSCERHPEVRLAVRLFHPDLGPHTVPERFYVTWGDSDLI